MVDDRRMRSDESGRTYSTAAAAAVSWRLEPTPNQVSGVDPEVEDEDVYEAAREGLSLVFGLDGVDAVSVTAATGGLVLSSDDDDDDDGQGEGVDGEQRGRRFLRDDGRSGLYYPIGVLEGGEEEDGSGIRHHLRRSRVMTLATIATTAAVRVGRDEENSGVPPRDLWGDRADLRSRSSAAGGVFPSRSESGDAGNGRRHVGTSSRELQEEEEGEEGGENVVNVEFEVILPAEEAGSGTASSRFAAAIDAYADNDGRVALADVLGVSATNVR